MPIFDPCKVPKLNIRPQIQRLKASGDKQLVDSGISFEQINDVIDKMRELLCRLEAAPTFFDKATFGIKGAVTVGLKAPHYHVGPFAWSPTYATINAAVPSTAGDVTVDVQYILPGLDPAVSTNWISIFSTIRLVAPANTQLLQRQDVFASLPSPAFDVEGMMRVEVITAGTGAADVEINVYGLIAGLDLGPPARFTGIIP